MNVAKYISRTFITIALVIAGLKSLCQQPPNILLITADDMGMQMGALNTPGVFTPTLDSLAKAGIFFLRAYAAFPSCSPSRTSILTGTLPHVNGVTTNVFETLKNAEDKMVEQTIPGLNKQFIVKENITTLVQVLGKAGYFTGLTGKFHVPSEEKFPFDFWGKQVDATNYFNKAKASGKPFFLDYNLHSPHRPYETSDRDRSKINLKEFDVPPFLPDNEMMQKDWSDYLGAVEATDASVKKVLWQLKQSGLEKNTIVIFISDHGPSTHRGKYYAYPFGSAVPMIFSGPGIIANKTTKVLASLTDVMPTILDLVKAPIPASVNGKSLVKNLSGADEAVHEYIYTEVAFPRNGETNYQARGMTDGRFWYIRRNGNAREAGKPEDNYDIVKWKNYSYTATKNGKDEYPLQYELMKTSEGTPPREELFDLHADPWTMHDIFSNSAYAGALERMRKQMNKWILETDDKEMKKTL